jgi:hypothetical protein
MLPAKFNSESARRKNRIIHRAEQTGLAMSSEAEGEQGENELKGCKGWNKWNECKVLSIDSAYSGESARIAREPIAQVYVYRGENINSVLY